jgi:hypothetical protein
MPAKDIYHNNLKNALIKDGWTITHDPYTITYGQRNVFVDFGAERIIGAEKAGEKIAIELKTFGGNSEINDLEKAVDQYALYRALLVRTQPERKLFIAISDAVFVTTFDEPMTRAVIEDLQVAIIVFNSAKEIITKWIP